MLPRQPEKVAKEDYQLSVPFYGAYDFLDRRAGGEQCCDRAPLSRPDDTCSIPEQLAVVVSSATPAALMAVLIIV